MAEGFAIVVDIGKTLSKVSLWSRDGRMLDRLTRPNEIVEADGHRILDVEGIGAFLCDSLQQMDLAGVEYIVPVAHGAGVVALGTDGVAVPPLDYEQELPAELLAEYRAARGAFAESGSPALPAGLNFGAQLFWLDHLYPEAMAGASLLPWAQYWAWFLSGRAVSEVTSLGCHSDLWCPAEEGFSSLAREQGWAEKFAPLVRAGDSVGTLRSEISQGTNLPEGVQVLAGLHDSNAALLAARGFAEIADNEATVLSTGTWFIAMRIPGRLAKQALDLSALPEARDCLVNVDAYGQPVPSARFMGGREIELLIELDTHQVDIRPDQPKLLAAVPDVVAAGAMVLPTLAPGNGPFPDHESRWLERPEDWYARRAAACLYAALVADSALDLIGSRDVLLVEGRFAGAEVFTRALASLRPQMQVFTASAHGDVSFGALRLIDPSLRPQGELQRVVPLDCDLHTYRDRWNAALKTNPDKGAPSR